MASLVSLCSFTHFTSNKTLIQDLQAQRTDSCKFLFSSSISLTGNHFRASKSWGKDLLFMKQHYTPVVAHWSHYCASVFLAQNVVCTLRVISGFWVGPDIEDGWGFVEATVFDSS